MEKKNQAVLPSLQEQVMTLKKQVAGLKGYNNQIKTFSELQTKKLEQVTDALATANEEIVNCKSKLQHVSLELVDYKSIVEWYNALPWYKKIFIRKIGL